MTEAEARDCVAERVSRETLGRICSFVDLVLTEAGNQNLISLATMSQIWSRHVLDSLQLNDLAPKTGEWLDLGTGAGFPGLIVAAASERPVTCVEQRPLRAEFLRRGVAMLGLEDRCEIVCNRLQRLESRHFAVISARAFARLSNLLTLAERFSTAGTTWILPKGRNAKSELAAVQSSWQGGFRLEPSLTDADAKIIVASGVTRRKEPRPS